MQLNKPEWERKGCVLVRLSEVSVIETVFMKKHQLKHPGRENSSRYARFLRPKRWMAVLFATCHFVDTLVATLLERAPESICTYWEEPPVFQVHSTLYVGGWSAADLQQAQWRSDQQHDQQTLQPQRKPPPLPLPLLLLLLHAFVLTAIISFICICLSVVWNLSSSFGTRVSVGLKQTDRLLY